MLLHRGSSSSTMLGVRRQQQQQLMGCSGLQGQLVARNPLPASFLPAHAVPAPASAAARSTQHHRSTRLRAAQRAAQPGMAEGPASKHLLPAPHRRGAPLRCRVGPLPLPGPSTCPARRRHVHAISFCKQAHAARAAAQPRCSPRMARACVRAAAAANGTEPGRPPATAAGSPGSTAGPPALASLHDEVS